ncbi:hypothetical protein C8A00DRAFT_39143, partial [Chaetomidium leptoderma]
NKILYAVSLLEGAAADGVINGITKMSASDDAADWQWATGVEFMEHLAKKYATLDLVADAELKLKELTQDGKFAAFNDFLTEFTNLADICDWDDVTRVRNLRDKMNDEMRTAFKYQFPLPAADDFSAWVSKAQGLSINIEAENRMKKGKAQGYQGYHQTGGNGNANKNNNNDKGDPMDLDNMRVNRMHPAEKERRAAEGLCFNCGQRGHLIAECNNATKTSRTGFSRGRGTRGNQGGQRGGGGVAYSNYASHANAQFQGGFNNGFGQQTPASFAGYAGGQNGAPGYRGNRQGRARGTGNLGTGNRCNVRYMEVDQPGYVVGEVAATGGTASDYYDHGPHEFEYPVDDDVRHGQQGNA